MKKLAILITGFIVFLDQYTKYLIKKHMLLHEVKEIIPNFLNLTYIENPAAAFGLLKSVDPFIRNFILFVVFSIAFLILIIAIFCSSKFDLTFLSLNFILGGAIGNAIDRIRFGKVIDFLDIYHKNFHWPAFNVADIFISLGIILIILHQIIKYAKSSKTL